MKKVCLAGFASLSLALGLFPYAHAYTFFIDELSITKNGSEIFRDSFEDGNPPPAAPNFASGAAAEYFVAGAVGPESGGTLTMDSADAVATNTAAGTPVFFQGALLRTNIDPADTVLGLKSDDTFRATALFDLDLPGAALESYGIRFTDRAPGLGLPGNDLVELHVIRTSTGNLRVQFIEADFLNNTVTIIDQTPLNTMHDQIEFSVARTDAMSNSVTASVAYLDGQTVVDTHVFGNTADIFDGENWTRVEFVARTPVPAPSTVLLLGSALAGLVGTTWKRKNR